MMMYIFVLIGLCDYFRFCSYDTQFKTIPMHPMVFSLKFTKELVRPPPRFSFPELKRMALRYRFN